MNGTSFKSTESQYQNRLFANDDEVTAYFLDSSAAAKLYVLETGSAWMIALIDLDTENQFFVTRITPIEVASVIFRRVKSGKLRRFEAVDAIESLRDDFAAVFQIVDLTPELSDIALDVADRFGLRGYDCVQLAASLLTRRYRGAAGLPSPTFISSDIELNSAARAEGFEVQNPHDFT